MVKAHDVIRYLTDGIEDNINNCEDVITSEYLNETPNSFEVEFTDYSMDGVKSKYRITIEDIDEPMDKKKREKLYSEHRCDFFKMIEETIAQYPLRVCVTDKNIEEYQKELNDFWQRKREETREKFIEMGFKLKDAEITKDVNNIKENKTMDNRVAKFLTEIMNGTEPNTAIENSGVGEMKFKDVLKEIAGAWKANRLEAILNCEEVIPNEEYQKLKEALNTIKELDKALLGMRKDNTENNE